ncbi:MAG: insulinase family protein [Clostridiales bacterium]|jgi:predicted Zn-dependent peptidase|nr:insulinase family protein [Clostridiales bacterium]
MTERTVGLTGQKLITETLPSGFLYYIIPQKGRPPRAALTVRAGSADGGPGAAHFVEHMLFEGADESGVNAFTDYAKTVLTLEDGGVRSLLSMAKNPPFSPEAVEAEKPIILSEIRMYADIPRFAALAGCLRGMFRACPVREPILGTESAVAETSPEDLRRFHAAFYRPDNMALTVAGDADAEDIRAAVFECFGQKEPSAAPRPKMIEQGGVVHGRVGGADGRAFFVIGAKLSRLSGDYAANRAAAAIALDCLAGASGDLFEKLRGAGLMDDPFGTELMYPYAALLTGVSRDPGAALGAVLDTALDMIKSGVAPEDFERIRLGRLGRFARGLISPEGAAAMQAELSAFGSDIIGMEAALKSVSPDAAREWLGAFSEGRVCLSSVAVK